MVKTTTKERILIELVLFTAARKAKYKFTYDLTEFTVKKAE